MFFDKNQAALRQNPHNLALLTQLEGVSPASDLCLSETPDGSYTLETQGILLHAPQGAETEAKRIAQESCSPSPHAKHLLIGLGLGYLLAEVSRQVSGPIFILEPDLPLLRFVLENVDLSAYFTPQVFLSTSPKALIQQLKTCYVSGDPLKTLLLPGCRQRYADILPTFQAELEHYLMYAQRERDLLEASHYHWIEAFFQNLPYFPQTQPLEGLRNAFQGKPALVISPGPSLDRAMQDVLALKDKMVTLAVGRALRPLMAAGMTPDFVAFVDYIGMTEQLHNLPLPTDSCSFLVTPFAQNSSLQAPAKHKFLLPTLCDDHFAHWLDASWQHAYARIEDATNASIFSFNLARWLGCNPIVLVGQDLAFQGEQLYAGGIQAEFDEQKGVAWVPGSETVSAVDYILSEIPGQDGRMLKTSTQYYIFAKELEALAQEIADSPQPTRLINASTGGAFLAGFEHLSLEQLCQQDDLPPLDKSILDHLPPNALPTATKYHRLHQALTELLAGITQAHQEAKSLQQLLNTMLAKPPATWPQYQASYQTSKATFDQLLHTHPFLYAALFSKTLPFRHPPEPGPDAVRHSVQQAAAYYTACRQALEESLLPWATAAHKAFEQEPQA